MLIAIEVFLVLAIVAGIVALEIPGLKRAVAALAAGGLFFVIGCFLLGSVEVGVAGAIALGLLVSLLLWALRRTTSKDSTVKAKVESSDIFLLVSVVVFAAVLLAVVIPLFGGLSARPPAPVEGPVGLSMLKEALVVLAVLAGIWAVTRKVGRREE